MLIFSLPGANSRFPEHKIEVFVLFWPSGPPFSGISSTKSAFLCAFEVRNPRFQPFQAQNRGFCAFLAFRTPVFSPFEHKIGVFVRFLPSEPPFSGISSTKSRFLCSGRRGNCVGKGSLTSVNKYSWRRPPFSGFSSIKPGGASYWKSLSDGVHGYRRSEPFAYVAAIR